MALNSRERVLYARHLLLAEVGSTGQERLCATWVDLSEQGDGAAASVAVDYLRRAGMKVRSDGVADSGTHEAHAESIDLSISDAASVEALAGAPELRHAAAALLGAFAATEAIKAAIGIGTKATFPAQLGFLSEDA